MEPNPRNITVLRAPAIARKLLVHRIGRRSRLGRFLTRLRGRSLTHGTVETFDYVVETVEAYRTLARQSGVDLAGKRVLEIGTGDNVAVPLALVALGCAEVVTTDPFDYLRPDAELQPLYDRVLAHFGCDRPFDEVRAAVVLRHEAIERLPSDWTDTFDVVVSHSTLEHVAEIRLAMANIARVLAPDGTTLHHVDLSSHTHMVYEAHPLEFLVYPKWLWRRLSTGGTINRERLSDYHDAFAQARLEVVALEVSDSLERAQVEEIAHRLAPPFRSRTVDDLCVLAFEVALRRP